MSRTTISEHGDARAREDGADADGEGLRRASSGVALVVAAGAAALLAVGAFLGLYVRPTSDDWCALWKTRDMGVLGITADFYGTQNGRVTNAFLTGLIYTGDMRGPKLLPAVLVVALGGGLFFLGRAALRALGLPRPPAAPLVAAAALLSALLFFAGTRTYQVLLWAPATISHTLPSVIGLWAVLAAVRAAHGAPRWARGAAVGSALVTGAALGMLSEPFTLVAGLLAATTGVLCLPRLGWTQDRYVSTWCAAACLGLATGLALLYTSPGARWRREQHPQEPLSMAQIGETFHDWWRVWQTIGGQGAYAGAVAVGVLLGLALVAVRPERDRTGGRDRPAGLPPRRLLRVVVLLPVPLVALASLAVVHGLRSGYGDTGWTYGRTWTSFLFPLLLALCAYGTWGGHLLGRRLLTPVPRPAARAAALVATGAVALGGAAALVQPVYDLTTATVVRSVAWDRQNARIRAEAAAGARDVAYRPLLIGGLSEPLFASSYERDWAARCTATYYGVDRIHRPPDTPRTP
ncbi:hypothetical protein [Streptomyces sp. NPDC056361]|uniref:hypothetical protein n=1 Tax=Streptomyces sp. NPDC056361 TaxID=3345795 RepID=UPI0035E103D0